MHTAAVLGTTRAGITMPRVCVCVCASVRAYACACTCVFILQAQSAGQDKYAFKRLIFHFRNWRRQNDSILSWRTQHKEWRGSNKSTKERKTHTHRERKEAQSRAFVVCAQTQLRTKLNICYTNPALLISVFVYCTAKKTISDESSQINVWRLNKSNFKDASE